MGIFTFYTSLEDKLILFPLVSEKLVAWIENALNINK